MFSGSTQAVRRFSLLLLDEGELYVGDYVATAKWPPAVGGNWQRLPRLAGQLRLCTKSLFFEPDDVRVPIIRLPFQYVEGLEGAGQRRLVVTASRLVKMRANAADAPYIVERYHSTGGHSSVAGAGAGAGGGLGSVGGAASAAAAAAAAAGSVTWEFELSYATLEALMPLAQQMVVASRLAPGTEQEDFLEMTMHAAEAGLRFDLGGLRSPAERIVLELGCTLLSQGALVREPGRLLVTDRRFYFQPLHNISGDAAVASHPLAAVAAAARRRSSLRDVALEVFFAEPGTAQHAQQEQYQAGPPFWADSSALFAFRSRDEREQVVAALMAQEALGRALPGGRDATAACTAILEADPSWLSRVTAAWQRGRMSNLDYLLFLNLASGRSLADLSQYPVFPWVLADYTSPTLDLSDPATFRDLSKPVGALNTRRLEMLQERYREMASFSPEPPFLYGSHYSTPGFTMFWLVRAAPAHMLRLQNGRFDAPDRLFCSVREAWDGVTGPNPADVKELIPEFFLRHDFLVNARSLALGTRQNGRPVGDVELPPWAHAGLGSAPAAAAARFQTLHRAALEAPFVSANLHYWIDLIFGFRQQGSAAVEADNVFRHTAYEGAVDIDSVADRTERLALETQINEFGQCPRQLFKQKHPQRLVCPAAEVPPAGPVAAVRGEAGGASPSAASHALPLALVSSILAAAASEAQGQSPRVEVSPLLRQLDVLAVARRREQSAAAVEPAGPTTGQPADAPAALGLAGDRSGSAPTSDAAASPSKQAASAAAAAAAGASSRLRSLGAWAAERKQAVGERLAGGVGAVREAAAAALAGPSGSGGSSSRLQSLFARKGSHAMDGSAAAAAACPSSPQAGSRRHQQSPPSPQPAPAQGLAAAAAASPSTSSGLGSKLAALDLRRQRPPGSPPPAGGAAAAEDTSTVGGSVAAAVSGITQQQLAGGTGADDPIAGLAAAVASSGGSLWKLSRRGPQPGGASSAGAAVATTAGASSDDEAASSRGSGGHLQQLLLGEERAGSGLGLSPRSSWSSAELLAAQRERMLRHGSGDSPAAAAPAGASSSGTVRPAVAGTAAAALPTVGAAGVGVGWFGPGLRDRLRPTRVLSAGSEAVNGCVLAATAGVQHLYSASHSGLLRVHSLASGEQVRACRLSEQPLTSVALLPASSSGGGGGRDSHPLVLCGSYDACVHAYSADFGRQLGSFQAAEDAVSCLQLAPLGGGGGSGDGVAGGVVRLVSASWDGSIKLWDLGEGRQPWAAASAGVSAAAAAPLASVVAPSGVWALSVSPDGHLVVAGSEDGLVAAWDLRQARPTPLWQQQLLADNYIGGVELCPSGGGAGVGTSTAVVVAAADGSLSLLDLRQGGEVVAAVEPSGLPLRCCTTDGRLALAGDEGGALHMWDVGQQLLGEAAAAPCGVWTPPQPDGLYPPLAAAPLSSINAIAAGRAGAGAGGGISVGAVEIVTAHEGGLLRCYTTAAPP